MSNFRDRLLEEKAQLDDRRTKLVAFLESEKIDTIDSVQITILNIQSQAMLTYSQCLLERIARLPVPDAVPAN
jgi:hypothetical protein